MKNKPSAPPSLVLSKESLLIFSLLAMWSFTIAAEEGLAFFDPMDVFELEWATDPRVSPDGGNIVYVRRSNDIMKDRQRSNLWQVSSNGKDHRPLSTGLSNAS